MKHFFSILLIFAGTFLAAQQSETVRVKHFNLENGVAIQGYDPVAYFSNTAAKGSKQFTASYKGITYYFSTENNKRSFLNDPAHYEPQYGGWCAFAMGDYGKKVDIDPKTFKIVEGKLYLFYNAYFNNTLKSWNKNETILKTKADKNWSIIIK